MTDRIVNSVRKCPMWVAALISFVVALVVGFMSGRSSFVRELFF